MRVWISCTVVGVVACSAGAFAYGCGVSAFQSCAENGTCVGDGGPDASMPDGSMGNDASDGGGGGDVVGSDVTGDVVAEAEAGCPFADDAGLQRHVRGPDAARALRDVQQRVRGRYAPVQRGHVHLRLHARPRRPTAAARA